MKTKHTRSLVHCKQCKGLLVKNMRLDDMEGSISFLIRCPHCKHDCVIKISISKLSAIDTE